MNTTKIFPVLYKKTKTGKTQCWEIKAINNEVITTYGELNGKLQEQRYTSEKKNVGKANETSEHEQALNEANSKWLNQLKKGYTKNPNEVTSVATPMKVKVYQEQIKNVKFPCFSTPKLNGINGTYRRTDGTLELYSRGGELYPSIQHLEDAIHTFMDELGSNELNGELYIHNTPLQDIQSAVTKPNELSHKLTFNIFDIADSELIYESRRTHMMTIYRMLESIDHVALKYMGLLAGVVCNSHDDIELHYNQCISQGLEGTVVKNTGALYEHNVRSSNMFKYKKALSAEFLIVGYELDKRNHPVFHLHTNTTPPQIFKAKPTGTHEFVKSIDPQSYLGNWATVEYEMLSKSGTPLKPIFIGLRDCTPDGKPLI